MEVSWNRIKEDTNRIVEEFDRLYTYERNYAECERIISDIFKIYSAKYNIKLDENENFDHIFHQLLSSMEQVIEDFTPTDVQEQTESRKIDKLFRKINEDIFQTTEIRGRLKEIDPSNFEFKRSLEKGISEAEERISQINEELDGVEGIYKEIFGTETPNLRALTNAEVDDISHFNIIEQKLNEVKSLQDAIARMTPGIDDSDIANNQASIDKLTADIEEEKNIIRRTNLVDEIRLNSINVNDIAASLTEVGSLKTELDSKATADFTELQNNLINVKSKYSSFYAIAGIDSSKMDPNTEEGRKAIIDAYGPFLEIYEALENDLKIYDKEIEVYGEQLKQIEEEDKALQTETPSESEIESQFKADKIDEKIDKEMEYYEDMVNAQMYGDEKYKQRYEQYLKIFRNHILRGDKGPSFVLRNEDGTPILGDDGKEKIAQFMTVDYDGIAKELDDSGIGITTEELIKFLQLEEYKEKLERNSKVAVGDKLALTEYKSYKAFKEAKTPEEIDLAMIDLRNESRRDQLYLNTYHYATNDYEFKKQHHATAGKIGETYIPIQQHKKGEGIGKALKVSAHNIYAYTRWQNPFKADSFLKGVGRMALNAGNIVTFLPRVITRATGNTISKFGYDENRMPNPYNGRRDARRGARVDYYREQGNGAFVARAKGWIDELGGKRKKETENAIMDRQLNEIRKGLKASYIKGATEQAYLDLEEQKEIVRRNREIRMQDARTIAASKETQGDIIRDPKDVDEKTLRQRTLQRVALEYADVDSDYVSNTGSRDHAKNMQRNTQFIKGKTELEGKKKIKPIVFDGVKAKWGRKKGSVVAADPIGRAIRSREIKNTLTRWYAIEQAALIKGQSALVRWGIGKINDTTTTTTKELQPTGKTEKVPNGGHYENPEPVPKDIHVNPEGNIANKIKMGDLQYTDQAYFEHTASPRFKSVNWIETPTASNTQAVSLDYVIPNNLSPKEYQILLSKYGVKAGDRLSYSVADEATRNLCQATGKTYASSYIDGMFGFTDDTNIVESIHQYFPEKVSGPLDVILESKNYVGKKGIDFLTDSYATSHGITKVMEKMNSWGTGWGIESVNPEALKSAKRIVDIAGGDIKPDPKWVADYVDKPIMEWVEVTNTVTDPAKKAMKTNLNRIVNGLEAVGYANETYDLVRPSKTKKEPGRETYDGRDR